jgi:23S rRNA (cytidine1920-2'-O)/16S rRNA (cytidine1409-2'-O)-methyltransferase
MAGRVEGKQRRSRLDDALVDRGLAETRSKARALILANDVLVNGEPVSKAGAVVREGDELSLKSPPRFVSRGGEKLDHALDTFAIDVRNRVAADFGASTGGFTDSLLQHGAARVYAIDVGYGQMAERLRTDPRVIVMDRVNVRNLETLPEPIDIVSIDVSFIGLRLVLPAALRVVRPDGLIVALVKPQFEAGRADVGRGGVVRDPATHKRVLDGVFATADELELGVLGLTASPLRGPAGNVEFLAYLKPGAASITSRIAIARVLEEAQLR